MTRRRRSLQGACATVCALLFLVGCGDDDDDATDPDSSVVDDEMSDDEMSDDEMSDDEMSDDEMSDDEMSDDEMSDDDAAATATPLVDFAGTWNGAWTNETFGSTGAIDFTVEVDEAAGTATFTLDLGGFVFGGQDPEPEVFTIPLAGPSDPIETSIFGPIVMSTNADASVFTGVAGAVPNEGIESLSFDGAVGDDGSVSGTYEVTFPDATTATGTFTFSKA